MEFRSVSAKLPVNEATLFKDFCQRKGISPAALIRELILREMESPIPSTVAARNMITYDKTTDSFTWSVQRDTGAQSRIMTHLSPLFLEDLTASMTRALNERSSFIGKTSKESVPVPGIILGRDKK